MQGETIDVFDRQFVGSQHRADVLGHHRRREREYRASVHRQFAGLLHLDGRALLAVAAKQELARAPARRIANQRRCCAIAE